MHCLDSNSSVPLISILGVGVGRRLHAEAAFESRTPSVTARLHGVSPCITGPPLLFVTSSPPFWYVSGVTDACFL